MRSHVVNFSKTRVGIGLGDGEAPRAELDVRSKTIIGSMLGSKNISAHRGHGELEVIGNIAIGTPTRRVGRPSLYYTDDGGEQARIYLEVNGVLSFEVGGYKGLLETGYWLSF